VPHAEFAGPARALFLRKAGFRLLASAFLLLPTTSLLAQATWLPLEVRFYNQTANTDADVQVLVTGTGDTDPTDFDVYFTTNSVTNQISRSNSISLSSLPQLTDSGGTNYRSLFVQYTESGSFWIGLTNQVYTNATSTTVGNPSPTGPPSAQWSTAPFVQVEYAYFGSGFDTVDVTAINELSVPTSVALRGNSTSPVTLQGPAGVTNTAALPQVLNNLRAIPGVNWFGAANNTNVLRLVGPSSAAAPGLMMPMGAFTAGGSGTANFLQGWPGFSSPSFSAYVSQVAYNTTNNVNAPDGQPWGMTRIHAEVGDPAAPGYFFVWDADVTFAPNTNTNATAPYADTNYVSPTPVLTNISIGVYSNYGAYTSSPTTPITNFPSTLGWSIRYTPDSGNPQNAVFSGYIYGAPASFNGGENQGYVTFYSNNVTNNWITNVANQGSDSFYPSVLDRFLNEIAFGFAGGFVQSPVYGWTNGWQYNGDQKITGNTNAGSPNTLIGKMNSTQWWDQTNGLYRANRNPTNNDGFYSAWGNQIFELSPSLYSHPISDRMLYVAYTPGVPLSQAHTNTNTWLEIRFTNATLPPAAGARPGVSSVSFGTAQPIGLVYSNQSGNLVVTTNTNAGGIIATTNLPYGFVPTTEGNATNPAFWQSNMILLTNSSTLGDLTNVPIPNITIAAANTNGGGVWISALPAGVSYDPQTMTFSGSLIPQLVTKPLEGGGTQQVINFSGMGPNGAAPIASIGVMTYATNANGVDVTVTEIPIFVNGTQPLPTVLGFDPTSGGPGTAVKIWGTNFVVNGSQNFSNVYFTSTSELSGWVAASNFIWPYTNTNTMVVDSNALTAVVPAGASTGSILVGSVADETATGIGSTNPFYITPVPSGFWYAPAGSQVILSSGVGLGHLFTTNSVWNPNSYPPIQLTVNNWQASMTDPTAGTSGYASTNLPRGLHVINRWITTNDMPGVVSNSWQGYIVGRMIDQLPLFTNTTSIREYSQTSTISAFNPVGTNTDTGFSLFLIVGRFPTNNPPPYPNSSTNTNGPAPFGSTNFAVTNGLAFSNVLSYSNSPSYWVASNLPAGLSLSVDLNASATDVQASIVGTPTNGSGTITSTILAVNVLATNAPYNSMPATNTNTITFTFAGPAFLSYNTWVTLWPGLTNTLRTADPDGDSFNNGVEYAFDGNPTVGSPAMLTAAGAGSNAVFQFTGLQGAATNYTVQSTTNLSTGPWTNPGVTVTNAADQSGLLLSNSYERREFIVPAAGSNSFYRVIFTNAP